MQFKQAYVSYTYTDKYGNQETFWVGFHTSIEIFRMSLNYCEESSGEYIFSNWLECWKLG